MQADHLLVTMTFICLMLALACGPEDESSGKYPFRDPSLDTDSRVEDLLGRMTLEEKVSQMVYDAPAIERLGIPAYNWWNEALHGVARAGTATVFPQAIGMAATWDDSLLFRVATVISDEGRAKYHEAAARGERGIYRGITFWSPNINIFRDPRWGRGQETYGEDPYLTGRMGVAFVRALQGDDPRYLKTVATPKHFAVHSGPEPDRHHFDARVTERDLRETYLPAFRACVVEAGAWSVMGAYNRYMGEACCASRVLLEETLRRDWGFRGYVVSDCWAIADIFQGHDLAETAAQASALAVKAGCDLNCGDSYPALVEAVGEGLISEEQIDTAVGRLFEARMRLGMFDPPEMVPWTKVPADVVASEQHRSLALETARKSIVLLKNEGGLLPLSKDIRSVAVIGPNADKLDVLLGNYHGTPASYVTMLEGIRGKLPDAEIRHVVGSELAEGYRASEVVPPEALMPPEGERGSGLKAEIFATPDLTGSPAETTYHSRIMFPHGGWIESPRGIAQGAPYSIRWTGRLDAPVAGEYALSFLCDPKWKIFVDGKQVARKDNLQYEEVSADVHLERGTHELRIETTDNSNHTLATLRWTRPWSRDVDQAVEASDAVIMFLGLSPLIEGEEMSVDLPGFRGGDRTRIELPRVQQELLERVVALGRPTVLVLLSGSAIAAEWADRNVPAIVQAWYPGQEGGAAVADVLFGDFNPAGRLPVTFYRSTDQLPPFDDYSMEGRTYRYFGGDPLYPFGHGLSYASFSYSGLEVSPSRPVAGDTLTVSVTVENTGDRRGGEVVQLYVSRRDADVPVPLRALAGFTRVSLEPGESRTVRLAIDPRSLSLIDDNGRTVIEPGNLLVSVGGKQPGFSGTADSPTTGTVETVMTLGGDPVELAP